MEGSVQPSVWDSISEFTKSARDENVDPFLWAVRVSSALNSFAVELPSTELAQLLVSHTCFENHVPIMWKFLEKALTAKLAPPMLVFALLSVRVIPNRQVRPAAYRLYMELLKRHGFSFASQFRSPNCKKIMKSIADSLHLSLIFGLHPSEPEILLVELVFSIVCQLLDASLDDEGLLELTPDKKSIWLARPEAMEIDGHGSFVENRSEHCEGLHKMNTAMAIELIGEFLQNKVTSRILYLACQNVPSHWEGFIHRLQLLTTNSASLKNSKHIIAEGLLQLASDENKLLSQGTKWIPKQEFHAFISSRSLISCADHRYGASQSALWLPIDLLLEDAMDESCVTASSAVTNLTGLVKALQAFNDTTWHETFLGLWMAALRLVHRWLILLRKKKVSCLRKLN